MKGYRKVKIYMNLNFNVTSRGGVKRHDEKNSFCGNYLYAPSQKANARIIDTKGNLIHEWFNMTGQPNLESNPPSWLRGWHHVELDSEGNLLAIVPHHSILKLDRNSKLLWQTNVTAHHDIDVSLDGDVYTITELPRCIKIRDQQCLILDNEIAILNSVGSLIKSFSIYDIFANNPYTDDKLNASLDIRFPEIGTEHLFGRLREEFSNRELQAFLEGRSHFNELREKICILRGIPGSPCDVIHLNTVEILKPHPKGLWKQGDLLISARNLNLVAVIDIEIGQIVWAWGPGEISRQHQPSMLPDGNILIFDNAPESRRSRLVEVDPLDRSIRWQYIGTPPEAFYTSLAGGCEMLPNGNILVSQSQAGRAFEVTKNGCVVWDWLVPGWKIPEKKIRSNFYRLARVDSGLLQRIVS